MSPVLEMRPAISDERHVERNVSAIYNRAIVMGGSLKPARCHRTTVCG